VVIKTSINIHKYLVSVLFMVIMSINLNAQQTITPVKFTWDQLASFSATQTNSTKPINDGSGIDNDISKIDKNYPIPSNANISRLVPDFDAINQNDAMRVQSPAAALTCNAINDAQFDDNFGTIPQDAHGTVGTNHLIMTSNAYIRVQDKTNCATSAGCTGGCKIRLNAFFAGVIFGGAAPSCFDPRAIYDPFADRYFIVTAVNGGNLTNNGFILAVSQTNNPTGAWTFYSVNDGNNSNWLDYPYLSFNGDKVIITSNSFNSAGVFQNAQIYLFSKSALTSGSAVTFGTNAQLFTLTGQGGSLCPVVDYDAGSTTGYIVQNGSGNSGGFGFTRFSTITGSIPSCIFNPGVSSPSTATWAIAPATNFADQLGTTDKVANGDTRIINAMKVNGAIWYAHTIFLPTAGTDHSAIQWWKITTAGAISQVGRIDGGTGSFKSYPSIAADSCGNALVGYSVSSATTFVGTAYSYRTATDALNTMQVEEIYRTGNAKYFKTFSGTANRWGDYSAAVLDPTRTATNGSLWTVQTYADLPTTTVSPFGAGVDLSNTQWAKVNTNCSILFLPVKVTDFSAALTESKQVAISFTIANEEKIKEYIIEKSKDGIVFETALTLPPTNHNYQQTLKVLDEHPFLGISYYRLKVVDITAQNALSKIVAVNNSITKPEFISLFPNPSQNFIDLKWYIPTKGNMSIEVFNILGKKLKAEYKKVDEGYYMHTLNVKEFAKGQYTIVLQVGNWKKSLPFIKE
jgi:Secretion system C-terminal sorting domain